MKRSSIAAIALAAFSSVPGLAHEPPPVIAAGDATVVYVFATSPQAFVPVAGLPSFLLMPGAEPPPVATQVVYTVPQPVAPTHLTTKIDVDCSNFSGPVTISGPDRFGLDKNGNGIGCELEDR